MKSVTRLLAAASFAFWLAGCVAPGTVREDAGDAGIDAETWDPFEPFNRAIFTFNEKLDEWVLKPVARGYDWLLPNPVKTGVGNFFSNLLEPRTVVNDLLQGKLTRSARDTGRFVVNSTFGILGIFDVAKHLGLEPQPEDFGQTFAVWGAGEGPYFVWPVIGPRSLRDTFGFGFDWAINPVNWHPEPLVSWGLWTVDIVDTRARFLPTDPVIERAAGDDKYLFIREAYRQRRINQIHDGNPPKPKFFEDEPPANNGAPPAGPAVEPAGSGATEPQNHQ